MTDIKVADCAVLFWDNGKLVWDDYLHHQQFALTEQSERVCRWFREWRDLDSIDALGEQYVRIAQRLLEAGVLIEQGSERQNEESRVLSEWAAWGPSTRYHHFASRSDGEVRYASVIEDELRSAMRAAIDPPPSPAKSDPTLPLISIPGGRPDSSTWARPGLVDALYSRRSVRQFTNQPIPLDAMGTIVQVAAGPVEIIDHPDIGTVLLKTSPSAGARTPIELYVYANNVDGLEPGLYHFAPLRGGLERVGTAASKTLVEKAVGGQPWLAEAAALVFYTAVLGRTSWRYENARAYRDILIELGHISQTILLTATAMGLGGVTATALVDEAVEQLLGTDAAAEPAFAVTALNVPVT